MGWWFSDSSEIKEEKEPTLLLDGILPLKLAQKNKIKFFKSAILFPECVYSWRLCDAGKSANFSSRDRRSHSFEINSLFFFFLPSLFLCGSIFIWQIHFTFQLFLLLLLLLLLLLYGLSAIQIINQFLYINSFWMIRKGIELPNQWY